MEGALDAECDGRVYTAITAKRTVTPRAPTEPIIDQDHVGAVLMIVSAGGGCAGALRARAALAVRTSTRSHAVAAVGALLGHGGGVATVLAFVVCHGRGASLVARGGRSGALRARAQIGFATVSLCSEAAEAGVTAVLTCFAEVSGGTARLNQGCSNARARAMGRSRWHSAKRTR